MTKEERAGPEVTVRRATARDVEQIAANIQSVADEGRYIWTERVTEEWKEFLRKKLIRDRGCSSSWPRSGRAGARRWSATSR